MELALLIICVFTMVFCMVARFLSKTILTAPMVFIAFGVVLAHTGLVAEEGAEKLLHLTAEIALVVLLFLDASQIDLKAIRKQHIWPERMLLIGLPLSVVLGTLVIWPFLEGWPLVAVILVAAILAPTDAALGQAVVTNEAVPKRERRALTIESGLNDGMALPIILLFASLTAGYSGEGADEGQNWLLFGVMQIVLGPAAGIVTGLVGGRMLIWAQDREYTSSTFEGVAALALAGASYLFASEIGGNGFIAAFTGGLAFGNVVKDRCEYIFEFTESEGQLLTWGAFLLVGMVLVPEAVSMLTPSMFFIIFMSLFIVRPAAIWLSLIGTDAPPVTRLFFGWFGPRGLATALFALLVVAQIDHEFAEPVTAIAINTVWISALLHGLSAVPAAKRYAKMVEKKSTS